MGDGDILFAAADEPVKRKGRHKHKKHKERKSSTSREQNAKSSSKQNTLSTTSPSTPPPVPRSRSNTEEYNLTDEYCDDEVWYAKWWMCGFADSFRDLVPKR